MRVVVVDCGSGNLASATRALDRAAQDRGIAATVELSRDPARVARADRLVLPGQGAFADCARGIDAVDGLRAAIEAAVDGGAPFLGICVGMQLMAQRGLEHAVTPGFGWIGGEIAKMDPPGLRLPQMGWNELVFETPAHPLLAGIEAGRTLISCIATRWRGRTRRRWWRRPITAGRWWQWWRMAIVPARNSMSRKARAWG